MSEGPLRVGRIAALNMYPVYHHLATLADPELVFTDGLPAALNRAVLEDELDVSAMSSIEFARHASRLELLPTASITASGAVDSIQLFSRVPFERVERVAVTPHSATSVALLRVLLGTEVPPFEVLDEPPDVALARVDGVLLIADEALVALQAGLAPHATDLAERWSQRTGLPMVFAVWAAREDVAAERPERVQGLARELKVAQERYVAEPEAVVKAAAERFPFPVDYIRAYFRRLRYGFGPAERRGLARFLELAREVGELSELPRLAA